MHTAPEGSLSWARTASPRRLLLAVGLAASAAVATSVLWSSMAWAAAPEFLERDMAPEAKTVTLLAAGEGQTKAGPPVRARDADGDTLTYSLSDGDPLHASFFTIDSATGQISLKPNTRSGVYRVRVSVSDDMFDSDDSDTDTTDVTIHVTSPGHYPWEDAWVQARSMTAGDGAVGNLFGVAIAAASDVIVVGAESTYQGANPTVGAAYVFDADDGAQLARLDSPTPSPGGNFGHAVDVTSDGNMIVVGALGENGYRGRVHIFTKPTTGWANSSAPTARLSTGTVHSGQGSIRFGRGVSVSDDGNTIAVGMPRWEHVGGADDKSGLDYDGAVVVFTKPSTGGWVNANSESSGVAVLTAGTRIRVDDRLGEFVDISGDGNTIAASAPGGDIGQGVVYVFRKPGASWVSTTTSTPVPRLSVDGAFRRQNLGAQGVALSYDGSTLVASAPVAWRKHNAGENAQIPETAYGSAYVYVRPADGWADATETAELTRGFGHKYDGFGTGVAVSSDDGKIAVGNPYSRSSNFRGSVYVYTKPTGGWADDLDGAGDNIRVLTAADSDPNHRYAFGRSLAFIGDERLAVGQDGYVFGLALRDGLSSLPAEGLYGDNALQTSSANIRPGSAHLFKLRSASPPSPGPSTPPPPPPDEPVEPEEAPAPTPPPPVFEDVIAVSVHAESIKQLSVLGIATGTTATTFSPDQPVTRAQMATFLTRTWVAAGRECPSSGIVYFRDVVSGSTHAAGIDCMSALGVTAGTTATTFSPNRPVTRAQTAAFLARAWMAADRTCPSSGAAFDDVVAGSTHAASINCVSALGIARGTASGTFSPGQTVTRAQMATFLARFYQLLTA